MVSTRATHTYQKGKDNGSVLEARHFSIRKLSEPSPKSRISVQDLHHRMNLPHRYVCLAAAVVLSPSHMVEVVRPIKGRSQREFFRSLVIEN